MKNRSRTYAFLTILIYLLCLAGGVWAIFKIPEYRHKEDQLYEAGRYLQRYLAGDLPVNITFANMCIAVYTPDGTVLYTEGSVNHPLSFDTDRYLKPLVPRALSSGKMYRLLAMVNGITSEQSVNGTAALGGDLDFVSAVGIAFDGDAKGVLFLCADNASLGTYVVVYVIILSVMFLMIGLLQVVMLRNRRQLEILQQSYIDNVTHNLKSPVASVKALLLAISDHDLPQEKQSEYIGIMLGEINRQESMIRNILCLSRIQNGRMDFSRHRMEAQELFGPLFCRYAVLCEDSGITWHAPEKLDTVPDVCTNKDRVAQILDVLIDNAIHAMPDGGQIELTLTQHTGHITLSLTDDGPGIDSADLPHVFERFYTGRGGQGSTGSGLGLSIALETATRLGEKLSVSSTPGQGTTFYLTIAEGGLLFR